MAGTRKPPTLRNKDGCYVANFYKPSGRRSTISFGPVGPRTLGEIHAAFGQWLDLYERHPHKVLACKSPYEAIAQILNPRAIVTVDQLLDKYLEWTDGQSSPRRDGRTHPDVERLNRLKRFLAPFGEWTVSDFGSEELRAVQMAMVKYRYRYGKKGRKKPYTRGGINKTISYVHKAWKWGIGREIVTEAQCQRLREVRPLRPGQTSAKDHRKRAPVTEEEFRKVLGGLTTVVADMLRLIWITAMRPAEARRMRPFDILRDDKECWVYIPGRDADVVGDHKTAYLQRIRAIPLTSVAQSILKPRIKKFSSTDYVFRPEDAMQEMRDRRTADRQTALSCGNRPGSNRKEHPMIKPGKMYRRGSFCNAVERACERTEVPVFTPYDLRRTAATRIRAELGKEAAKLLLGHVSTDTTDIYLLEEVQEAIKVAKQMPDENIG